MLLDLLGYDLDYAIEQLKGFGVNSSDIIIHEYKSPKADIIGSDRRIIRVNKANGKIRLVVGNF